MKHDRLPQTEDQPWRPPPRDYALLPAICLLTILVILGGGEVAARKIYVQSDSIEPCEYVTSTGFRYHPGCTSHTKVWEGPWVTQHFNECGYRLLNPALPGHPAHYGSWWSDHQRREARW